MGGIAQIIFSVLGSLLYPLFSIIYLIIDTVQDIFYAFAGLGTVTFGGKNFGASGETVTSPGLAEGNGADNANGIIYYLFRSETAKNILFSMIILGVFLLIVFTVMAFIKNMYAAKQKKWQEIFSNTLKGAVNFIFLPVLCLLGVIGGNALLQVLNDATATSSDITLSRQLFIASSYSANKFRDDWGGSADDVVSLQNLYNKTFGTNITLETGRDGEYYAEYLDDIFASKNGPAIHVWWEVNGYYHLWSINYLLLGAGGVFLLFALLKISFGALKRLFMLVLLFVISPAVCSLYPLDEGSAVNKWRSEFIKQFFSVYGAVIGLNLFFAVVPLINSISLGAGDVLGLVPLLITIAGLYMVSDAIRLITGFIPGAGDAYSEGASLAGNAKKRLLQGTKAVGGAGRKVIGAFSRAHGSRVARHEYLEKKGEEAGDKAAAAFETTRDSFTGTDEEFEAAKKRAAKDAKKAAMKDRTNKKDAGTGFFGSMGSSVLGGMKNLTETVAEKTGFGKFGAANDARKEGIKAGREKTEGKQKTNAAIRKANEILGKEKPADLTNEEWSTTQMRDISKLLSGTNGDTIWGVLKKNKDFQTFIKGSGAGVDLSSDTAADVGRKLKGRQDVIVTQSAVAKAEKANTDFEEPIREKIKEILDAAGSTLDLNKIMEDILAGKELAINTGAPARDIGASSRINDYVKNDLGGKDAVANRSDELRANVQTATLRAQKVADENRENGDAEFTRNMDEYMGYLQQTLNSLKDNKAIREMDSHMTEKFTQLIAKQTEMIKQIKDTSKQEQESIKKSLKEAAQKSDKK